MFDAQEQEIIRAGQELGKSADEIRAAVNSYRSGVRPTEDVKLKDIALGAGKGLLESGQAVADLARLPGRTVLAGTEAALTDKTFGESFSDLSLKNTFEPFQLSEKEMSEDFLAAKNQGEKIGKVGEFGAELAIGGGLALGKVAAKGVSALTRKGLESLKTTIRESQPNNLPSSQQMEGISQQLSELTDRVPRFIDRVKQQADEAADRAQRIKAASPEVGTAIKSGLDDRLIYSVENADEATVRAYKEMLDIAESKTPGLTLKQRPEIVAGKAVSDQFKLVDDARKQVGKEIGEQVAALSTKGNVPILQEIKTLEDVLAKQGAKFAADDSGKITLNLSGTKFTPAQRTKIEELYKLATEGGDVMSPRAIKDKDQLFSNLQREARFEGIGDIIVDTDQGPMSLFRVFRDVFNSKLDDLDPSLRVLNREYRNLSTLVDDIESTIIKSGKYDSAKGVDPSEFAQTNLRRLLSDAQSAADYRAIANQLDSVARELGYKGARSDELIAFATKLREIYPENIPPTSFSGGIRTGVKTSTMDMIGKVMDLGAPNVEDKQKALRALLESRLGS